MNFEVHTILAALVTGGLLAVSGHTLQGILRNPLAEPYMLGLVGGASFFAALTLHFGWDILSPLFLPGAAFTGSCLSLGLVLLTAGLANRRPIIFGGLGAGEMVSPSANLILAGFVTGSITCSLQMVVLSQSSDTTFARLSKWLFGNLRTASTTAILGAACILLLVLIGLRLLSKYLDVMELGPETAALLGINVRRIMFAALLLASLATATAVALAGAIGFVGLIVPHIIRRLVPWQHRIQLPLVTLAGGLFLLVAEGVSHLLPGELPAGIICALIGGPFFLMLLYRRAK